jgi:hypothetical protein
VIREDSNRTRYLKRLIARGMDHAIAAARYRTLASSVTDPAVKRDLLNLAADHDECLALSRK